MLTTTLAALFLTRGPVNGVTDTAITLGMANAQSGPASALGKGMRTGAEAAFEEVNAKGGIFGRKIKLVVEDDGYEPNKTIDATIKLIEEHKVFSLFGYVGTPTTVAALPIVKDTKTPLFGIFSGAMAFRQPVTPEIINVRASYNDEPEKLVDHFKKDLGAKTFAVFHQDDGFGAAVLAGTEKALKKRGLSLSGKGSFQRNTLAVQSGLAEVMKVKPDVIIMAGPYAPLAEFAKQVKANGLKCRLATVSFVGTENFVKAAGDAGEGVVISQVVPHPDSDLPVVKAARAAWAKKSSDPMGFVGLEGYITGLSFTRALEAAGKDLTRDSLIKAIDSLTSIDLGGFAMGYSPTNHQGSNTVYLTVVKAGRVAQVSALN